MVKMEWATAAGDGSQALDEGLMGGGQLGDAGAEGGDAGVDVIEMIEQLPQHEAMVGPHLAGQRLL